MSRAGVARDVIADRVPLRREPSVNHRTALLCTLAAALLPASACIFDPTSSVRLINQCPIAVEVLYDGGPVLPGRARWAEWAVGEAGAFNATRDLSTLYVWVRPVGSDAVPEPLVFERADHPSPPGDRVDMEVALEGESCPS